MRRRISTIIVVGVFMVMISGQEAIAGCCYGCIIPGNWTCASWIKGSVEGVAHSRTEFDTKGCLEWEKCPEHRQGIYGSQKQDGSPCDPRPIDVYGKSSSGCYMNFLYNCVSKDCVDDDGNLIQNKKCLNQIASSPNSSHTQDGGGLFLDALDEGCDKRNCRSTLTSVTFEFGTFSLYCPAGQLPVNIVLDSYFGFTEFCEGGRDIDKTCCRTEDRDDEDKCIDTYGDKCSDQLNVQGVCPDGFFDSNDIARRIVEEYCSGGAGLLPGDEYTCEVVPPLQ
jgi:hypothetical protein